MRTQNGQKSYPKCKPKDTMVGATTDLEQQSILTTAQSELIDRIMFHGIADLIQSLKFVHDATLYHSEMPIDEDEKTFLFNVKVLWEWLEAIEREK